MHHEGPERELPSNVKHLWYKRSICESHCLFGVSLADHQNCLADDEQNRIYIHSAHPAAHHQQQDCLSMLFADTTAPGHAKRNTTPANHLSVTAPKDVGTAAMITIIPRKARKEACQQASSRREPAQASQHLRTHNVDKRQTASKRRIPNPVHKKEGC